MPFTLVVKNSQSAGRLPNPLNLEQGELALNLADGKLYSKNGADEIFEIGASGETPGGGSGDRPSEPSLGDLFYDTEIGAILYWDGDSWEPVGKDALSINDLTDVDTTGLAENDFLVWNGTNWVPKTGDEVRPQAGRALTYDGSTTPDTLNADIATDAALGVVSVGNGIDVSAAGEISANIPPFTEVSPDEPTGDIAEGTLWYANNTDEDFGGRLYIYIDGTWVDSSLPGGTDDGSDDISGLYLSSVNADSAAEVIEFKKGVKITGGDAAEVSNGLYGTSSGVHLAVGGNAVARFRNVNGGGGNSAYALTVQARNSISSSNTAVYGEFVNWGSSDFTYVTDAVGYFTKVENTADVTSTITNFYGYRVEKPTDNSGSATSVYGFYSNLNAASGTNVWGVHCAGDANNFFRGSVKIAPTTGNAPATSGVGVSLNISSGSNFARTSSTAPDATIGVIRFMEGDDNGGDTEQRLINLKDETGNVGVIRFNNGGIPVLAGTSDIRSKENVADLGPASDIIKGLRPVTYNYKTSKKTAVGFVAHEVDELVPTAVGGEKDAVDKDGNPIYQDFAPTELIPYLTKALQECLAKNEQLEQRLAALEGA